MDMDETGIGYARLAIFCSRFAVFFCSRFALRSVSIGVDFTDSDRSVPRFA